MWTTLVDAILRLVVRGAPAIGAAGGVRRRARRWSQGEREGWRPRTVRAAVARIREARPTAVNLMVCVDRVMPRFDEGLAAVLEEAAAVQREDLAANRAMGAYGADWLLNASASDRPLRILTHCNTGRAGHGGLGHGTRRHPRTARARTAGGRLRRRDPPPAPGLPPDRLGAGPGGHPALRPGRRGRRRHDPARRGRRGDRRRGPHRGQRRHREQGRHGGRRAGLRRRGDPVPGGGPDDHGRPRHRRPATTSTSNSGARTRCWSGRGVRTAPAESRGHNPAFDVTPGRLVTGLVTERGVLEVSAGQLPGRPPEVEDDGEGGRPARRGSAVSAVPVVVSAATAPTPAATPRLRCGAGPDAGPPPTRTARAPRRPRPASGDRAPPPGDPRAPSCPGCWR